MSKKLSHLEKFIELRSQGLSFEKIARELAVSKQTLINWSKEFSAELQNFNTIRLEAIQETYKLTRAHQIEVLGKELAKIRTELEQRDYSNVPTEKLLDMQNRLLAQIKGFDEQLLFREKNEKSRWPISWKIS